MLNPRTYQAIDQAITGRAHGPLLLNQEQRRFYITIGLLQGVPLRKMQRAATPRRRLAR